MKDVNMHAAYFFKFNGLDRSITLGRNDGLLFYAAPLLYETDPTVLAEYGQMVFYNDIPSYEDKDFNLFQVNCNISRIHHMDFKDIYAIQCESMYTIVRTAQEDYYVDVEQDLGEIYSHEKHVEGWLFSVDMKVIDFKLINLSEI